MNYRSYRLSVLCLSLGLCLSTTRADETFSPYKAGEVPQNVTDLWKDYDARKESLDVQVVKEWKGDGVVTRYVTFKVGTFKGVDARVAAYYSFPTNAPRSKQTPYEGGIRTPILFSWPKSIKPAKRTELVSSIDIVPTILAAAGSRIPKDLPGLNLLSNLQQDQKIERQAIFGESFAHDIADIDNPQKSLLFRWCIEGRWKLLLTYDGEVNRYKSTHPRTEKRPQLFDLREDPHEKSNVAADHPEVVSQLAKKIAEWYPTPERKVLTTFK